jgi:hypothetical protein
MTSYEFRFDSILGIRRYSALTWFPEFQESGYYKLHRTTGGIVSSQFREFQKLRLGSFRHDSRNSRNGWNSINVDWTSNAEWWASLGIEWNWSRNVQHRGIGCVLWGSYGMPIRCLWDTYGDTYRMPLRYLSDTFGVAIGCQWGAYGVPMMSF